MFVSNTTFDFINYPKTYIHRFCDIALTFMFQTVFYLNYFIWRKFCLRATVQSEFKGMRNIFSMCHKFKIFETVICFYSILMIYCEVFWNRSVMSIPNKSMYKNSITFMVTCYKRYTMIRSFVVLCLYKFKRFFSPFSFGIRSFSFDDSHNRNSEPIFGYGSLNIFEFCGFHNCKLAQELDYGEF